MPNFLQKCKMYIIYPISKDWTKEKVKDWIEHAGGEVTATFDDSVTHVICSDKVWREKGEVVQKALELWNNGKDINIVEDTWLYNVLHESKKLRIQQWLWNKPQNRAKQDGELGLRGTTIKIMRDHINSFVDERDKEKDAIEKVVREKVEREFAQKKAFKQSMGKKSRAERVRFFKNHNRVFTDEDGFEYEVLLRKVETHRKETEIQEVTLRIFETVGRGELQTGELQPDGFKGFTVSGYSAKTQFRQENHMIVARYVNLPTALRYFKKMFWELTGIQFDTARADDGQGTSGFAGSGDQLDQYAQYRGKHFVWVPDAIITASLGAQEVPQGVDNAPQIVLDEHGVVIEDDADDAELMDEAGEEVHEGGAKEGLDIEMKDA